MRHALLSRILLVAIIIIVSVAFVARGFADEDSEHYKIVYLLNAIGESDLVFIRNGNEYTGAAARTHLQEKLDYAGNRIRTAEDFINYVASKSTMTGTPYFVRLPDGTQIEAGTWLRGKLSQLK